MDSLKGPQESNLRKVGCDLVVATTQASLNAGLKEYLHGINIPTATIFFIHDGSGKIIEDIDLETLKQRSGGLDPFDIPHYTDWEDARVQKLVGIKFSAALKMRIGLPPNITPRDVPNIVEMMGDISKVKFRLTFSEFIVISCMPGSSGSGKWQVFDQSQQTDDGRNQIWYFEATVSLLKKDLSKNLDTPYFKNHPKERDALKRRLDNLSSMTFSLEQLLLDLDSARVQKVPEIKGLDPDSPAHQALSTRVRDYYVNKADNEGLPPLNVIAIPGEPDPSKLSLTAYERRITESKINPAANTLDHVCAIDGNPLPPKYAIDWNWVSANELDRKSGVIAINRNAMKKFVIDQIIQASKSFCLKFNVIIQQYEERGKTPLFRLNASPGETLKVVESDEIDSSSSSTKIARLEYKAADKHHPPWLSKSYATIDIAQTCSCDVAFVEDCIVIQQDVEISLDVNQQEMNGYGNSLKGRQFHQSRKDLYYLQVDQGGSLRLERRNDWDIVDPIRLDGLCEFRGLPEGFSPMDKMMKKIAESRLNEGFLDHAADFIFPGSKVFTYTNPRFSKNQDLLCDLTYLSPSSFNDQELPVASEAPRLKIEHSSELMQNYVYGEIVSPEGKFVSLQTDNENGHALLFAIDSNQSLNVFQECSGVATAATGWKVSNLSASASAVAKRKVDDPTEHAIVRSFAVGQSPIDRSIGMAIGIDNGGADLLCVSLGNCSRELSWIASPAWISVPFDGLTDSDSESESESEMAKEFRITEVMFAETFNKVQYLVVDVKTRTAGHQIVRYHIDMTKSTGKAWVRHDIPIDLGPGKYQSVIGRMSNGLVDGTYTAGSVGKSPQLIYQPIINVYDDVPPSVTEFKLPDGVIPTAITTVRNADGSPGKNKLYGTTDLYVIAGSKLFRWPADKQTQGASGEVVLDNEILAGTTTLLASQVGNVVTLWGNNTASEVYYLSCCADKVKDASQWSFPVPILEGMQRISAYVNRVDGGNTIFASGSGKFTQLVQASHTTAKMWRPHDIRLEAKPDQPLIQFDSYTTTIRLLNDKNEAVPNTKLCLRSDSHTPAYINGRYYVLGKEEIKVSTDASGILTVVEASEDLQCSVLSVCFPKSTQTTIINPKDKSLEKISSLDTTEKLAGATIPEKTVAGGVLDSTEKFLVDRSVAEKDIKSAAKMMGYFKEAYGHFKPPSTTSNLFFREDVSRVVPRGSPGEADAQGFWGFLVPVGDFFRSIGRKIKKGIEDAVKFIKDTVTGAWNFVANIAGKVYHAVLDTVEAVVGGVKWLFNTIKTAIEEVMKFLKFLFEWGDIQRTKKVLHNMVKQYLRHQVQGLGEARMQFDRCIDGLGDTIKDWGGITDWSSLGKIAKGPPGESGQDPLANHTSASLLFAHHYRSQANNVKVTSVVPEKVDVEADELIQVLLDAIAKEGGVLADTYHALQKLAVNFKEMTTEDIIKQIVAILGTSLLSSVKVVDDALFRVLISIADSALNILDAKLHIPVISQILKKIGVPEISFLDLFCWIAAVGVTVVYKAVEKEAPFPDHDHVQALIDAGSWEEMRLVFTGQIGNGTLEEDFKALDLLPGGLQKPVHITGHSVSGFLLLIVGGFLAPSEAMGANGESPFTTPSIVVAIVVAATSGAAAGLAPRYPIQNKIVSGVSWALIGCRLAFKGGFSGWTQKRLSFPDKFSWLKPNDGRATGAIVDSFIAIPELFVTCYHFYELRDKAESERRSAAILGEVGNIASYFARISYAVAVNAKDPPSKAIPVGIMIGANVVASGLQLARASQVN